MHVKNSFNSDKSIMHPNKKPFLLDEKIFFNKNYISEISWRIKLILISNYWLYFIKPPNCANTRFILGFNVFHNPLINYKKKSDYYILNNSHFPLSTT